MEATEGEKGIDRQKGWCESAPWNAVALQASFAGHVPGCSCRVVIAVFVFWRSLYRYNRRSTAVNINLMMPHTTRTPHITRQSSYAGYQYICSAMYACNTHHGLYCLHSINRTDFTADFISDFLYWEVSVFRLIVSFVLALLAELIYADVDVVCLSVWMLTRVAQIVADVYL